MNKVLSFLFLVFIINGVNGQIDPLEKVNFYVVEDIDFSIFDNGRYEDVYNKIYDKDAFFERYFRPWKLTQKEEQNPLKDHEWNDFFTYTLNEDSPCYLGNYNAHSKNWEQAIKTNFPNKTGFPQMSSYGLVVRKTNLRNKPTDDHCLKEIRDAGEGYPFDYFQHAALPISTPLRIWTQTNDGLWVFVSSPYDKGWVKISDIGLLSKGTAKELMAMDFQAVIKDEIPFGSSSHRVQLQIGTLLAYLPDSDSVLLPGLDSKNGKIFFDTISSTKFMQPFPVEFNAENVKHFLAELFDEKYGWGGLDGGRDCASFLRDYFLPFGIYMPIWSKAQSKNGKVIPLENSAKQILSELDNQGIPFLTSVYKPGHIMLYVGKNNNGTPLIYHNVWGLKGWVQNENLSQLSYQRENYAISGFDKTNENEVEIRYIIGRSVITEIEPAAVLDEDRHLNMYKYLEHIDKMTIHGIREE